MALGLCTRPLLWSVMLVLATGCITWSMICVLLVVLLVRRRRAPGTVEPEAEVATVKTTELGALELSMSRVQASSGQLRRARRWPGGWCTCGRGGEEPGASAHCGLCGSLCNS